ncbi:spore coat protein [Paenactinomyces guangxiensis]|uniref:Spore coat protein n=1 Tax=Paenactinomyces guangxiensis TaxID=1490290 RepID=A0A7W2A7Q3_9BACL|nr:spore coat protein [Paenactinomyces guangxiensis]MBA4494791.1 spore coat protein [Paenactinomyces guangxiensis]MBH8591874.1 spore coat protein [Paenactinomyces guangxiensis]
MPAQLGAHEIMEMHEVLTDTIDGINQFELYRPHVTDPQLGTILDNQIQYMIQEYNQMVAAVNQKMQGQTIPTRQFRQRPISTPSYGLNNPTPERPNASIQEMDDRDVASGMLGCAKSSATLRMHAALECADPQLRRMLTQGAVSCAEQAYETFQYMNQKGYYQVPTMQTNTTSTMMSMYQPTYGTSPQIQ